MTSGTGGVCGPAFLHRSSPPASRVLLIRGIIASLNSRVSPIVAVIFFSVRAHSDSSAQSRNGVRSSNAS